MTNLIILGDRHKFSDMESRALNERFSPIEHISYKDSDGQESINQIERLTTDKPKSIILLNTQAHIPNELLSYLVKLESKGISYLSVESFLEKYLRKCYIPKGQTNIDFLEKIKTYNPLELYIKIIIDIISTVSLSIIAIPIGIYSAYRIKKESSGSIFFRQTRVGKNGILFTCYKFRSMNENSHYNPYTQKNDTRIFPWGNTMRKYRIDELPQLWNILKQDMHLIGPRAEWDILVNNYEKEISYYSERHLVRPGITGWAQVHYPYGANSEDAKQKLMYDLYYIKYWSLALEAKSIWKTIIVVLMKKGV